MTRHQCIVQYDYAREWLWCIKCRQPKMTLEWMVHRGIRL